MTDPAGTALTAIAIVGYIGWFLTGGRLSDARCDRARERVAHAHTEAMLRTEIAELRTVADALDRECDAMRAAYDMEHSAALTWQAAHIARMAEIAAWKQAVLTAAHLTELAVMERDALAAVMPVRGVDGRFHRRVG